MAIAVYCPEDPRGPVSQEQALQLLALMHDRAEARASENASIERHDPHAKQIKRREEFDLACIEAQVLQWASELVKRIVLDPRFAREAYEEAAQELERQAQQIRYRIEGIK
jgi:hypothetical protein